MSSEPVPATPFLALTLATLAWAQAGAGQVFHVVEDSGIALVQHSGGLGKDYITESTGAGAAMLDFDLDGRLDLVLANGPASGTTPQTTLQAASGTGGTGQGHRLYRGNGHSFQESPAGAGVRDVVWGSGVTWGDVDNDGWPDLFITAIGPDRLYRNNGDGSFATWIVGVEDSGWGAGATFTDWDADGNLDLYVARYVDLAATRVPGRGQGRCFYSGVAAFCGPEGLIGQRDRFYRNLGNGRFAEWLSDRIDSAAAYGLAPIAFDCDDDGLPELYVANDSMMNLLYRRARDGDIVEEGLTSGAGYSADGREQAGMGVTSADFDGDGRLDLFVTNFQNDHNTLYRNLGGCAFQDETDLRNLAASSFPYMGWSAQFLDVDGDADEDLFVANGHIHPALQARGIEPYAQLNLLYRNRFRETGTADFARVDATAGDGLMIRASSRAAVRGDYDNDGDFDLLVTNIDERPTLLRNELSMQLPWLRLTLVGRQSNRSAYGAQVVVSSGGLRQRFELRDSDGYAGANDPRLLIYLPGGRADSVEIEWSGGATTRIAEQRPGWLVIDEQRGVVARRLR